MEITDAASAATVLLAAAPPAERGVTWKGPRDSQASGRWLQQSLAVTVAKLLALLLLLLLASSAIALLLAPSRPSVRAAGCCREALREVEASGANALQELLEAGARRQARRPALLLPRAVPRQPAADVATSPCCPCDGTRPWQLLATSLYADGRRSFFPRPSSVSLHATEGTHNVGATSEGY